MYEPTAEEISQATAAIRDKWTDDIERERREGFTIKQLMQMFANLIKQDTEYEERRRQKWRERYARRLAERGPE